MPFLARAFAGAAAATLFVLAAPLSASAASDPYTPHKPDSWQRTIVPQTFVSHTVPDLTFDPGETLQVNVTSESPAPTLATFTASLVTGSLTSSASGGAVVKLNFGASTHGVYDVTVSEAGTDRVSYGVVTVIPAKASAVVAADPGPSSLARTGTTIDVGVLWGAGAAIAAGIVLWVFSRVRRRTR